MTRWSDDPVHADPSDQARLADHRPHPLGRTALTAVAVYTVAAVLGWALVGLLAALVLL